MSVKITTTEQVIDNGKEVDGCIFFYSCMKEKLNWRRIVITGPGEEVRKRYCEIWEMELIGGGGHLSGFKRVTPDQKKIADEQGLETWEINVIKPHIES